MVRRPRPWVGTACVASPSSPIHTQCHTHHILTPFRGTAHESIVPYQAFECKDGMYMVGAGNDKQFERLMSAIGMPELSQDPRFRTNRDRTQHRAAFIPILEAKFRCVPLFFLCVSHAPTT